MSWFSGAQVPVADLENKISEATSESIPNGEIDLSIGLEITDLIRSKKIPPKQCMRALKKRLTLVYQNPNLLSSTLKLVDLCVKNGGYHFLVEISTKEFIDYLVDFIFIVHYNTKDQVSNESDAKYRVGMLILSLLKEWKIYFENQMQLNYVEKRYNQLVNQGYEFPNSDFTEQLNSKFIDSDAPPDWVDNNECMICYTPFSLMNRKHHCRSCGGIYCQTHSSHRSPLVSLGIMDPVRVCDNCYERIKMKNGSNLSRVKSSRKTNSRLIDQSNENEDEDLRRAIELSLQDGTISMVETPQAPQTIQAPAGVSNPGIDVDEEDEDMKAAIAASLKEQEEHEKAMKKRNEMASNTRYPSQNAVSSDLYSNILPFDEENQTPNATLSPKQHRERHTVKLEDLTPKEEEQINLYITLMMQIRNDPAKQENILYDSNLNELHSQVIRLKPKLNKSLRSSIERYEAFLGLNNKISTITRLYDQFLESKLSMAYGNHAINSSNAEISGPSTYGVEYTNLLNQYNDYNSLQNRASGYLQYNPSGSLSNQQTGYSNPMLEQRSGYSYQQNPQGINTQDPSFLQEPSAPDYPTSHKEYGYLYESQPEQDIGPAHPINQSSRGESEIPQQQALFYGSPPYLQYQQSQNYEEQPQVASYSSPQSQEPSEPVYPGAEYNSNDNLSKESASSKFPPIEEIEAPHTQVPNLNYQLQNNLPDLPTLPPPTGKNDEVSESHASEPEPLIEL
ncbi:uncharacterized protein PRCAT00003744001 [Priceomyces carsonii]|uniref:uncharacterized protein n=1 Tax=Priceomyces carsonii TaxID=28549 RepID=UPI002ED9B05B|nr:unnamed protein product [Priceomyces carsonii]